MFRVIVWVCIIGLFLVPKVLGKGTIQKAKHITQSVSVKLWLRVYEELIVWCWAKAAMDTNMSKTLQ